MNLHSYLSRSPVALILDNLRYWSTSYRPLGGLFYVALYRWFGFDPLPFRVAHALATNAPPTPSATGTFMPKCPRITSRSAPRKKGAAE